MMVASISETTTNQISRRPFSSSEKDHGVNNSTRPKSRHISSRNVSPSPTTSSNFNPKSSSIHTPTSTRRSPSPLISRNSSTPTVKRSISAERKRPTTADLNLKRNNAGRDVSAAAKLLVTSRRSMSASFQGEAFSLNKTKMTPNLTNVRKGTPETKRTGTPKGKIESRLKDHVENTKPIDQHRWPCKTRQVSNSFLTKSLSLDCADNKHKVIDSGNVIRALHKYMNSEGRKASINGGVRSNSSLDLGNPSSHGFKSLASPKSTISKKLRDSPLSSPRTMDSSSRMRPGSPSVFMSSSMRVSSPMRGMISPIRSSRTINIETPSVLSFGVDVQRRKVGENWIVDAHLLRLLYNRQLQWRFVNARTEDILLKRELRTEKYLWNTWVTTSDLHDCVTKKRHRLQLLRQKLKLASILKQQMGFLENWACLDKEHSRSLLGAIESLKGSSLRLPVGGGAIADLESMKDAIVSAMVVMKTMVSSIRSFCLKAEEVNSLIMELANISAKERTFIRICKDFLSMLMALKVKDCSLRTHMLQKLCV